jgi:hypothetical protein
MLHEDAWNILHDNGKLLEEINDYYIVDDDNVQLYVKFVGQDPIWVDYKTLYGQYPEATSAFFRQSDLPFMYPKEIVDTETLIPEEEDEDEDDDGELNRITMDAEHEQPNTTKLDNTYTMYDDYDDEHSNTIDTQEQHTTTQHYGINEDDKDSVVTENDIEDDMCEPVTDDQPPPPNVDHAPPSPIVRRSSRNRFPNSRFNYRARAAITKHFSDLCLDVKHAHKVEIDKIDISVQQTHIIDPLLPTPHQDTLDQVLRQGIEGSYQKGNRHSRDPEQGRPNHPCYCQIPSKDYIGRVSRETQNTNCITRRHDEGDDVHPRHMVSNSGFPSTQDIPCVCCRIPATSLPTRLRRSLPSGRCHREEVHKIPRTME